MQTSLRRLFTDLDNDYVRIDEAYSVDDTRGLSTRGVLNVGLTFYEVQIADEASNG